MMGCLLRQLDILQLVIDRHIDDRGRGFVDPSKAVETFGDVKKVRDADFLWSLPRGFEAGVFDPFAIFIDKVRKVLQDPAAVRFELLVRILEHKSHVDFPDGVVLSNLVDQYLNTAEALALACG